MPNLFTTEMIRTNAIVVYNSLIFESDLNLYQSKSYRAKNQLTYVHQLDPEQQLLTGIIIWKYVIEEILHFDPQTALAYLDEELVKTLKLDKTIPLFGCGEKDRTRPGYAFVLQFLYPKEVKYAEDQHTRDLCERAKKRNVGLPKSMFWSQNEYNERAEQRRKTYEAQGRKFNDAYTKKAVYRGKENAIICMQTIVYNHLFGNNSIEELYEMFADEEAGRRLINGYGRFYNEVVPKYFPTALEYFHESLYKEDRNELWYMVMTAKRNLKRIADEDNFELEL